MFSALALAMSAALAGSAAADGAAGEKTAVADGTPVENVYIVGNDSLGTLNESNKAYVTYGGCAQGWALTSGRLAGANAAAAYAG